MPHMIADMVTQGENAHFQMLFFQMLFIRPCNPIDEGYVILLITIQSPVLVTCLTFPGAVMKEVTWFLLAHRFGVLPSVMVEKSKWQAFEAAAHRTL